MNINIYFLILIFINGWHDVCLQDTAEPLEAKLITGDDHQSFQKWWPGSPPMQKEVACDAHLLQHLHDAL